MTPHDLTTPSKVLEAAARIVCFRCADGNVPTIIGKQWRHEYTGHPHQICHADDVLRLLARIHPTPPPDPRYTELVRGIEAWLRGYPLGVGPANAAAENLFRLCLAALTAPAPQPRQFPLLGFQGFIPWALAEEAYAVYAKRYGTDQSLERLAERGGFGTDELDDMLPGWRERIAAPQPSDEVRAQVYLEVAKWAHQQWNDCVRQRPEENIYRAGMDKALRTVEQTFLSKHNAALAKEPGRG